MTATSTPHVILIRRRPTRPCPLPSAYTRSCVVAVPPFFSPLPIKKRTILSFLFFFFLCAHCRHGRSCLGLALSLRARHSEAKKRSSKKGERKEARAKARVRIGHERHFEIYLRARIPILSTFLFLASHVSKMAAGSYSLRWPGSRFCRLVKKHFLLNFENGTKPRPNQAAAVINTMATSCNMNASLGSCLTSEMQAHLVRIVACAGCKYIEK